MANLTNFANPGFPSSGGFSFGNIDSSFTLGAKLQNQLQGQNSNNEGKENNHKKRNNKKMKIKNNKQQGDDNAASNGLEDGGDHDEENEDSQNGQVCKASKKIRKRTLDKLKKRSEKDGFNGNSRNPNVINPKNKRNSMSLNKFAPGKVLNPMMFHKTKICPHFIEGSCKRGENCNYAHSQNELKEVPNLKKTKMCQLFQIGKCNMGNLCSFAHGDQELRSTSEFFKTSMCNSYLKGNCRMGDKCRYAHGQDELRKAIPSANFAPAPTFTKEKEHAPVQSNLNMSSLAGNSLSAAEPTLNAYNLHKNENPISGFMMPGLNSSSLPTNTMSNLNFSNMAPNFGGFSFGPNTNKNSNVDSFGTSNMFGQALTSVSGNKSVEKKPATQPSVTDGIAFTTFNPDMLASFFNPNANKSFFG